MLPGTRQESIDHRPEIMDTDEAVPGQAGVQDPASKGHAGDAIPGIDPGVDPGDTSKVLNVWATAASTVENKGR